MANTRRSIGWFGSGPCMPLIYASVCAWNLSFSFSFTYFFSLSHIRTYASTHNTAVSHHLTSLFSSLAQLLTQTQLDSLAFASFPRTLSTSSEIGVPKKRSVTWSTDAFPVINDEPISQPKNHFLTSQLHDTEDSCWDCCFFNLSPPLIKRTAKALKVGDTPIDTLYMDPKLDQFSFFDIVGSEERYLIQVVYHSLTLSRSLSLFYFFPSYCLNRTLQTATSTHLTFLHVFQTVVSAATLRPTLMSLPLSLP